MTIVTPETARGNCTRTIECQASLELIFEGRTSESVQTRIDKLLQEQKDIKREKGHLLQEVSNFTHLIADLKLQAAREQVRLREAENESRKAIAEERRKQERYNSLKKIAEDQAKRIESFTEASERGKFDCELRKQTDALLAEMQQVQQEIDTVKGPKTEELKRKIGRQKYINDTLESDIAQTRLTIDTLLNSALYKMHKEGKDEVSELMALGNEQIMMKQAHIDGYIRELEDLICQKKEQFIKSLK